METRIVLLDKDCPNQVNGIVTIKDHSFSEACRILTQLEKEYPDDLTEMFITQLSLEGWLFTYTNDVCSMTM